ncbi:MAG: TonB-dependent receptor, partial [Saprospiraceae bacterium]|nr:TonB-dependent receptor [Saprospiraceae bacterium]
MNNHNTTIKHLSLLFGLLLATFSAFAQTIINGQVLNSESNAPLVGATIQAMGSDYGTITNHQGQFNITASTDSLIISFTGYNTQRIPVSNHGQFLTIYLTEGTDLPIVTILGLNQPEINLQLPASVQEIPKAQIQRTDELNPAPLFNQIPGMFMQSGALNTNRITIRGIGNRIPFGTAKIRAYLDDIPLTNGVGETVLEDIDLSLVDNISIHKGPTSSSYGAGLGGLIQYQTNIKNRPNQYLASQQFGSYGISRTVLQADLSENNLPYQQSIIGSRTHSDGYRSNNTYDRYTFSTIAKWYAKHGREKATLFINYNDIEAGIPSSLNANDFIDNPDMAAANWARVSGGENYDRLLLGLSHNRQWLSSEHKHQLASTISLFSTARNNFEIRPFNILRENNRALGIRTKIDWQPEKSIRSPTFTAGLEFFNERYQWTTNDTEEGGTLGELQSDQQEIRKYYNLFAEFQWTPFSKVLINAGINLNETQYTLDDRFPQDQTDQSGAYAFQAIWSPRLQLTYQITPRVNWYTTLSHGFAAPTLEETLLPDGSRNPDIQPERGLNLETGSRGSFLWGKLSYELAVYRMWISDLLVARRTELDQFIGINAGSSVHQGFDARLTYRIPNKPGTYARLFYSFSDYFFDDFQDGENDFSGNALTGQPPHQVGLEVQWTSQQQIYIHGRWRLTDAFPILDNNELESDAYQITDIRIGWDKTLGKRWKLSPYLGVQNVFNEKYASMVLINARGFGRNLA